VAHPARRYNYWLGGKDNFQADRDSGDAIAAVYPPVRAAARENRHFLQRVVRWLTAEAGVRQFLDIGTGIPTADNTHEVAQRIDPSCRVVYVDNDPIVLAHARALLTSTPQGATAFIDADLRDPERILSHPDLLRTLDLTRPVALMLVAILHFLTEQDDPYAIVARLLEALPSGSYVCVSNLTADFMGQGRADRAVEFAARGEHGTLVFRDRQEFARFFAGLDLVDPGVRPVADWRPEIPPGPYDPAAPATMYGAVARLP
jgi:hypothetical protein